MEKFQQLKNFCKKPWFVLILILAGFFLKGIFIATLFPIFVGQDEARHYNTVQYLAEPAEKNWTKTKRIEKQESAGSSTLKYNYTQEIKETAKAADDGQALYNTLPFSGGYFGKNEALINSHSWRQYNTDYPPNTAGSGIRLYHLLGSKIEKFFAGQSILIRFYLVRIFSVFLGTLTVFLSYFIIKNSGFSAKNSLILAALISFQPRFSIYTASVNPDALLILTFTLFTLGAVLALKNGLDWKNLTMAVFSVIAGFYTKGTATILVGLLVLLFIFLIHIKIRSWHIILRCAFFALFPLAIASVFFYFRKYLPLGGDFAGIVASLREYLSESLTMGRFALTARTYWGTLTWVTSWFMDYIVNFIWIIESFAAAGLAIFFFSKKQPEYLPGKKYVLFLLMMVIALQAGIRLYDWKVFDKTGELLLGTPGRYFLPNLSAHIVLVFAGLGMILRKEKYFNGALALGLIAMFAFSTYLIFNVITFRFYL